MTIYSALAIAAIDASFMSKAGSKTEGLGNFYCSKIGKAEKGLELSLISVIDLKAKTAYSLSALQTIDKEGQSRVDSYAEQISQAAADIKSLGIQYIAADSYYTKIKFIKAVCEEGFDLIGKLRTDADLYWPYKGQYNGRGRPRKYDGKVDIMADKERFDLQCTLNNGTEIRSKVVYSKQLKQNITVTVLYQANKRSLGGYALLFSTDASIELLKLVEFYKARFQIEFIFRDAKQHTGLMDCQARKKEAIHTQINASIATLNLLKFEDRLWKGTTEQTVISIASYKRKKFNEHLMFLFLGKLGLSQSNQKVANAFDDLSNYGAIAA